MTVAAVVTEGIVRTFEDVLAVDGVDLEVQSGEIDGFLGPNGAGKSTLVRMLCTLLAPSAGRATVAGYDVVAEAERVRLSIQGGYFDRLCVIPVRRLALLLGLMVADIATVIALTIPVVVLGFIYGVHFETGFLGMLVFMLLGGLCGLAFTGFPYAIALKTGNPAAVNSSFLLFFPFAFLTTAFVPKEALTGWMETAATYNPVTYLLAGERAIISEGWEWGDIFGAVVAIAAVGFIGLAVALAALRGRVKPS